VTTPGEGTGDSGLDEEHEAAGSGTPMDVKVDCYAGYRGEETPRWFEIGGRRVEVVEVIARWSDPDHRYFKVRGDDGAVCLLRYDDPADRWELEMLDP
jgi:hypothetical protein